MVAPLGNKFASRRRVAADSPAPPASDLPEGSGSSTNAPGFPPPRQVDSMAVELSGLGSSELPKGSAPNPALTKANGLTIAPSIKGKGKSTGPAGPSSARPSSGKSDKWTHTFVTALDFPIKPKVSENTIDSSNGSHPASSSRAQRQSKVDAISKLDTTGPVPLSSRPQAPISLLPPGPPQSMRMSTANPLSFLTPLPLSPSTRHSPSPQNNPLLKKSLIPRSAPLDMSSVRTTAHRHPPARTKPRVFGLKEAPTFYPTEEEFKDPMKYIAKIGEEGKGKEYGICKVVPPEGWKMPFVLDTETFRFKTRLQRLNSLEASSRAKINFLDQLYMFHRQQGNPNITIPVIDHRPLDLWALRREVAKMGGPEEVSGTKAWGTLARTLAYTQAHAPHLKSAYIKIIQPYEDYNNQVRSSPLARGTYQVPNAIDSPLTPLPDSPLLMKKDGKIAATTRDRDESPVKAKLGPSALRARSSSRTKTASDSGSRLGSPPDSKAKAETRELPYAGASDRGGATAGPSRISPTRSAASTTNGQAGLGRRSARSDSTPAERKTRPIYTEADSDGSELSDIEYSGELASVKSEKNLRLELDERKTDLVTKTSARETRRRRLAEAGKADAPATPPPRRNLRARPADDRPWKKGDACEVCRSGGDANKILLCDDCDRGFHIYCLDPPLLRVPENEEWFCPACLLGTGNDFGFDEGEEHSIVSYQERSDAFREAWFAEHPPSPAQSEFPSEDAPLTPKGATNGVTELIGGRLVSEHDVEAEFWRLVHSEFETVEVEYGADIHSTTHSSASPCLETQPLMKESSGAWNVNNMPILPQSLLRYIKTDISGMTVPWTYIGMLFSTFCWHNEDHYTYSVNYQHWGDTKTWYGISGADADRFEAAIKSEAPELFEQQPSLMYQLVTMMSPGAIEAAGIPVYACDQRPNEFVITFPKAYHCGFNQGLNLNEAVNFALPDWLDLGYECVLRYQAHSKAPVFSHEELLVTMSQHSDSIETAVWLKDGLTAIVGREISKRDQIRAVIQHLGEVIDHSDKTEEQYICVICKAFCFLSQVTCSCTKSVSCLDHYASLCRCAIGTRILRKRLSEEALGDLLHVVVERAAIPVMWRARFQKVIDEAARPSLKALRGLVADGERIGYPLPELSALRPFVAQANTWVERAAGLFKGRPTVLKRQRRGRDADGDVNMDIVDEDLDRGGVRRSPAYIVDLRAKADRLGFDCPEIGQLDLLISQIQDFQSRTEGLFAMSEDDIKLKDCQSALVMGESLNVELPDMQRLEILVKRLEWVADMDEIDEGFLELKDVREYLTQARDCDVSPNHEYYLDLLAKEERGEDWLYRARKVVEASEQEKPTPSVQLSEVEDLALQDPDVPVTNELAIKIQQIRTRALGAQTSCKSVLASVGLAGAKRNMQLVKRVIKSLEGKATGIIIPEALPVLEAYEAYQSWLDDLGMAFDIDAADVAPNFVVLLNHVGEVWNPIDDLPCKDLQAPPTDATASSESIPHSAKDFSCYCRKPLNATSRQCRRCFERFHAEDLVDELEIVSSPFRCALCRGKSPRTPDKDVQTSVAVMQNLLERGQALNERFAFEEYESVRILVEKSQRITSVVLATLRPFSDRSQTEDSQWLAHWLRKLRDVPFSITPATRDGQQIDLYQALFDRFKELRRILIANKKKKSAPAIRAERHWPMLSIERPLVVEHNGVCLCEVAPADSFLVVKCQTCATVYHQSCVHAPDEALGKKGRLWACPSCCVIDGHEYAHATILCQAKEHIGTSIYIDTRATLAAGVKLMTRVWDSPPTTNLIRLVVLGFTPGKRVIFRDSSEAADETIDLVDAGDAKEDSAPIEDEVKPQIVNKRAAPEGQSQRARAKKARVEPRKESEASPYDAGIVRDTNPHHQAPIVSPAISPSALGPPRISPPTMASASSENPGGDRTDLQHPRSIPQAQYTHRPPLPAVQHSLHRWTEIDSGRMSNGSITGPNAHGMRASPERVMAMQQLEPTQHAEHASPRAYQDQGIIKQEEIMQRVLSRGEYSPMSVEAPPAAESASAAQVELPPGFVASPALTAAGWSIELQSQLQRDHRLKGPSAAGGTMPPNRGSAPVARQASVVPSSRSVDSRKLAALPSSGIQAREVIDRKPTDLHSHPNQPDASGRWFPPDVKTGGHAQPAYPPTNPSTRPTQSEM